MKLYSAKHGAQVQRPRRQLFTINPLTRFRDLAKYAPELFLFAGMILVVVAVWMWSTPIAVLTAGGLCMILAWLLAFSRGS